MKTFNKYISESINEALIKKNTSLNNIKYHPKTKEELKSIIREKLDKMVEQNSSNLYLADIDVSEVDDFNSLFMGMSNSLNIKRINILGWNSSKVDSMMYMFALLNNLEEIQGIEDLDMTNVERMSFMFLECKKLKKLDLSKWNTENVTSMSGMFKDCQQLTEIIGIENIKTKQTLYMHDMFYNCFKLKKIDINKWNTSQVMTMESMFKNCKSLKEIKIGKIDTQWVSTMVSMFENCQQLVDIDDLSGWDLHSLTSSKKMFKKCYNLIKIKGLDNWFKDKKQMPKDMDEMFMECVNLRDIGDIEHWNANSRYIRKSKNMFKNTNIDTIPTWYIYQ